MPHSERQIQTGTSTMRAMTQEMNAGRMMSFVRSQRETGQIKRGGKAMHTEKILSGGFRLS